MILSFSVPVNILLLFPISVKGTVFLTLLRIVFDSNFIAYAFFSQLSSTADLSFNVRLLSGLML